MPLLNYTTDVPASRSIQHVQQLLVKGGARSVMAAYDEHGVPTGIAFQIVTPFGPRSFTLPVNTESVHKVLAKDRHRDMRPSYRTQEHAERVAWRILKDWIEAQLALIASEMVSFEQVMLPYMHAEVGGRTVYELYRDQQLALPATT